MFILNVGYKWDLRSSLSGLSSVLYLPSANSSIRLTRSNIEAKTLLMDPQLYLAGLDASTCGKACSTLAGHAWFLAEDIEEFDSAAMGQREWKKRIVEQIVDLWPGAAPTGQSIHRSIEAAFDAQTRLGVSHIILPSPLVEFVETDSQVLAEWLDAGLDVAADYEVGQPLLATIAVRESVLSPDVFTESGFLNSLIDQVSSRGITGVYIVVVRNDSAHPFECSPAVARAYAHLTNSCSRAGIADVFVNFADTLGQVCMGLGASMFASGQSQSLRRISLASFRDSSGGKAFPYFYSNRSASEFLPRSHLEKMVVPKRLLRQVRDVTRHSKALMDRLQEGGNADEVPAWAESQNNTSEAARHYVSVLLREAEKLDALDAQERNEAISFWLTTADATQRYLAEKVGENCSRPAPVSLWLSEFERYSDQS